MKKLILKLIGLSLLAANIWLGFLSNFPKQLWLLVNNILFILGLFQLYTEVAKLSYSRRQLSIKNKQGCTVIDYLQEKGYQSDPNYKKIIDIYLQVQSMSKGKS